MPTVAGYARGNVIARADLDCDGRGEAMEERVYRIELIDCRRRVRGMARLVNPHQKQRAEPRHFNVLEDCGDMSVMLHCMSAYVHTFVSASINPAANGWQSSDNYGGENFLATTRLQIRPMVSCCGTRKAGMGLVAFSSASLNAHRKR